MQRFTTAVIGLGLIGGSLAYALRGFKDGAIVGYDLNPAVTSAALQAGAIDAVAQALRQAVEDADLCVFCADPDGILAGITEAAPYFKPGAVVTEICGVKQEFSQSIPHLLPHGVHYIGLHPMAGKEVGGFANAEGMLFRGAGMILVPPEGYAPSALELIRELCEHIGAGRILQNSAAEHDSLIGYTSDLMHISATALVAEIPEGFTMAHTAGSFRDCTRVANIDAHLWTELLLRNRAHILPHLRDYIRHLRDFEAAMEQNDEAELQALLQQAGDNKRGLHTK